MNEWCGSRSPPISYPTPFLLRFMHLPNQINNDEFVWLIRFAVATCTRAVIFFFWRKSVSAAQLSATIEWMRVIGVIRVIREILFRCHSIYKRSCPRISAKAPKHTTIVKLRTCVTYSHSICFINRKTFSTFFIHISFHTLFHIAATQVFSRPNSQHAYTCTYE